MSKNEKLTLKKLRVDSFVTSEVNNEMPIKGGTSTTRATITKATLSGTSVSPNPSIVWTCSVNFGI